MMKQLIFTLAFLFFCITAFAQKYGPPDRITFSNPESITPKNLLRFAEMEHNFGTRYEAEGYLVHDFVFKNISSDTVYISQVRASCGCTVPSYSRKTIPPGGTDKVGIKYDPKNRPGMFVKTMTIEVTKDFNKRDHLMGEEVYVVAIKGNTIPIEETKSKEETEQTKTIKPTHEVTVPNLLLSTPGKPESMPPKNLLRFDEMEHNFGMSRSEERYLVHNFVFKNISNDTVYISVVRTSCGCLVPEYTRRSIIPGGTDSVKSMFNQNGRSGGYNKTITVRVVKKNDRTPDHLSEEVYVLSIKGYIIPIEETKSKEETKQTKTIKPTNEDTTANTVLGSGLKKMVRSTAVEGGLQAYPNPTRGTLTLKIPDGAGSQSALLQITDQVGKIILKREIEVIISTQELEIDLSGNPAGIYTLSLTRPSDIQNIKVVLE